MKPATRARPADGTYSSSEALAVAGITYRQLDYWSRAGVIEVGPTGSGFPRRFTAADVRELNAAGALRRAGLELEEIRLALGALRANPEAPLLVVTSEGCVAVDAAELVDWLALAGGAATVLRLDVVDFLPTRE